MDSRSRAWSIGSLIALCAGLLTAPTLQSRAGDALFDDSADVLPPVVCPDGALSDRGAACAAMGEAADPAAAPAGPVFGGPLCERPYLTGDWLGLRTSAAEQGIAFDLMNTQFYQGLTSGGNGDEEFEYGGKFDYYANIDGAKAGLWKGFFIQLHGETRYGQDVAFSSGGISPVNTAMLFPVPNRNITALTGVQFTQALSEDFLVFLGKINLLDFYQHPFAAGRGVSQFMNTSLCLPLILGRTTPYSTLGAGFSVLSKGQPVAAFAVLDPSGKPTTAGFDTLFSEGAVLLGELNIPVEFAGRPGHQTLLGVWSSRTFNVLDRSDFFGPLSLPISSPIVVTPVHGSWALLYGFDQYLYVDPSNPKRGWGIFGQASISDGRANPIRSYFCAGVGGSSVLPGREADTFGLGWYFIGLADRVTDLAPRLLPLRDENGVEFYYNVAVTPWFHLTADVQAIDPARVRADTAVFFGLRGKIDF